MAKFIWYGSSSYLIVLLVRSIFDLVLIKSQTCRNRSVYTSCSTNPDCGCLPFSSADDRNGICAYLHLNASKLHKCSKMNYYCDQPYTVCIHHPNLSINQSLCYPTGMAALELCPPLNSTSSSLSSTSTLPDDICANASWTKRGITIVGSNFSGSALNQLRNPTAILFDLKTNTLYVSDNGNARVVTWQKDTKHGTIFAGGNAEGNRTDQIGWISDMLIDPKDRSLIICDARNRRIVRWARRAQQAQILIDNLYCSGIALDNQRLLYVTEHENHRVTRWTLEENITRGQLVAGGNGKGARLDQLNEPSGVFVDQNQTVYIADFSNDRVMKWINGAKEGILIGKIRWPKTVHLDQVGNIYSIDGYYNRIVRWMAGNNNSTIIIGEQQYTLSQPMDLAFDQYGNIFVSNYGSGRIDKFDIDRSDCF